MPLAGAGDTCGECLKSSPPFERTAAPWLYAGAIASLLPRFKFHAELACGRLLATLALEELESWEGWREVELVIPVPPHVQRLRQRGYNQALELARPLARALRLPLRDDLLRRCKATTAQSRLDATARRHNLRDAFTAVEAGLPAHVALIDDVMTTGATLQAAARALRVAGVQRVDAWVCARVA